MLFIRYCNFPFFLFIASCGHPNIRDAKVSTSHDHGKGPSLEGTIVNFTCPHNLDLIGPTASTCAKNGEWEPDPMEVECRGYTV